MSSISLRFLLAVNWLLIGQHESELALAGLGAAPASAHPGLRASQAGQPGQISGEWRNIRTNISWEMCEMREGDQGRAKVGPCQVSITHCLIPDQEI